LTAGFIFKFTFERQKTFFSIFFVADFSFRFCSPCGIADRKVTEHVDLVNHLVRVCCSLSHRAHHVSFGHGVGGRIFGAFRFFEVSSLTNDFFEF
jgi:hypothetical protein